MTPPKEYLKMYEDIFVVTRTERLYQDRMGGSEDEKPQMNCKVLQGDNVSTYSYKSNTQSFGSNCI